MLSTAKQDHCLSRERTMPPAVERFEGAKCERDRRADRYEAACGSSQAVSLHRDESPEDQFAAREAWLEWVERDY
jgi:hypothetical protein